MALSTLFGQEEEGVWQPLIVGAIVDEQFIDDGMEAVVSVGGLWFCVVPVERLGDVLIWTHEFIEAAIRMVLDTMDMELLFNHGTGYQAVPISHVMSALTTTAAINNEEKEPDEYWEIMKQGLPFHIPEGGTLSHGLAE